MPASPNEDLVSLVKLKNTARRLLPANSITRNVIISEPDVLMLADALSKFEVFDRLLVGELGASRGAH